MIFLRIKVRSLSWYLKPFKSSFCYTFSKLSPSMTQMCALYAIAKMSHLLFSQYWYVDPPYRGSHQCFPAVLHQNQIHEDKDTNTYKVNVSIVKWVWKTLSYQPSENDKKGLHGKASESSCNKCFLHIV